MQDMNAVNYKSIYCDLLFQKYPDKLSFCQKILNQDIITAVDVIELNNKIFGKPFQGSHPMNSRHRSYKKKDILWMLDFQKENNYNNSQLSRHFGISRNSVSKWKKLFKV